MPQDSSHKQIALKVGEINAFTDLSVKFLLRSGDVLRTVYGNKFINDLTADYRDLSNKIAAYYENTPFSETVLEKTKKTIVKLEKMQNMYIGDSWNNGVELSEWLGFFIGSSVVHWNLVLGRVERLKIKNLSAVCIKGIRLNKIFFEKIINIVRSV